MHNNEAEWRACKVCQMNDIPLRSVVRGEPTPEWDPSLAGPEYHMYKAVHFVQRSFGSTPCE